MQDRLNILVLYSDAWTHISSAQEHLRGLAAHSRHRYFFFPAAETAPVSDADAGMFQAYAAGLPPAFDLDIFDAVVWHFVMPAHTLADGWIEDRIADSVADALARYQGPKILFVQDEYDSTQTTWHAIRRTGIQVVMTCVPPAGIPIAYPSEEVPGVEFIQTLAGYVPDDSGLERFALPMAERRTRLAYRARVLPHRYGSLGRDKYEIGVNMRRLAEARGVPVDIEWAEDKRIYGDDWYRFLGSARGMLATQSGSRVFDFDGALHADETWAQALPYETYYAQTLAARETQIDMGQISPKVFEAIALRTALVCFEGNYSDVIEPNVHYIPLAKDYANADEVFAKLEDLDLLQAITERAYADVIGSDRYSYRAFAQDFDRIIEGRAQRPARAEIISAPIVVRRDGGASQPVVRGHPFEYLLNTGILHGAFQRRQLEAMMARTREAEVSLRRPHGPIPPADVAPVAALGPDAVRCYEVWSSAGASLTTSADAARLRTPPVAWHYAAGVHLDLSTLSPEHEHGWVKVTLSEVSAALWIGLYDAAADELLGQVVAQPGEGRTDVWLRVHRPEANLLMFRTGPDAAPVEAAIHAVEVFKAPAYPPELIALAQSLVEGAGA